MLPPVAGAVARPAQLDRNAFHSETLSRLLRLGVALVTADLSYIASRCRRQYVCVRNLQAPGMIISRDSVSGVGFHEPTPSVVRQSRSIPVQLLLQRYTRYDGCNKAGTRHTIGRMKRPAYPRGSMGNGT